MLVVVPATNGVGAVGMWLNSLGYLWAGSSLTAVMVGIIAFNIWRMDRSVLRQMAPILWLCGGAIAVIVLTDVSPSLGAPRSVQMTLLTLVVVLSAAFLVWGSVSVSRRLWNCLPHGQGPGRSAAARTRGFYQDDSGMGR